MADSEDLAQEPLRPRSSIERRQLDRLKRRRQMAVDSGYKGVNLLQSGSLTVQFAPSADQSFLNLSGFGDTSATFNITGLSAEVSGAAASGANWVSSGQISCSILTSSSSAWIAPSCICPR